jgi:uncharacterized protein YhfF
MAERIQRYWRQFLDSLPPGTARPEGFVEAFHFGTKPADAAEVNPLVLDGTKTATGALLWALQADAKAAAQPGDHWIVTDGYAEPVCVICTLDARVISFDQVGEDYARWGGERDRDLKSWRDLYWEYIVEECRRLGRDPDRRAPLVMERFELVYAEPLRDA